MKPRRDTTPSRPEGRSGSKNEENKQVISREIREVACDGKPITLRANKGSEGGGICNGRTGTLTTK